MAERQEALREFVAVTGAEEDRARFFLESAGGDLQIALASFYEDGGDEDIVPLPQPLGGTGPREPPHSEHRGVTSFRDLVHAQEDEEEEEEGQRFYAGGSERSGQQIVGPPRKRSPNELVEDLFRGAKEHGAVAVDRPAKGAGETNRPKPFAGGGYRLGAGPQEESAYVAGERRQQQQAGQDVHVVLKLWKGGFSLDQGQLRAYQDPANAHFLESIRRGEVPAELRRLARGGQVNLDMEDHRDEDFVKPKGSFRAFTGQGQKLGSTAPQVLSSEPAGWGAAPPPRREPETPAPSGPAGPAPSAAGPAPSAAAAAAPLRPRRPGRGRVAAHHQRPGAPRRRTEARPQVQPQPQDPGRPPLHRSGVPGHGLRRLRPDHHLPQQRAHGREPDAQGSRPPQRRHRPAASVTRPRPPGPSGLPPPRRRRPLPAPRPPVGIAVDLEREKRIKSPREEEPGARRGRPGTCREEGAGVPVAGLPPATGRPGGRGGGEGGHPRLTEEAQGGQARGPRSQGRPPHRAAPPSLAPTVRGEGGRGGGGGPLFPAGTPFSPRPRFVPTETPSRRRFPSGTGRGGGATVPGADPKRSRVEREDGLVGGARARVLSSRRLRRPVCRVTSGRSLPPSGPRFPPLENGGEDREPQVGRGSGPTRRARIRPGAQ
uniref:SEP domain-containing protein n=1 Tax=Ornithorhynchus anatinus TaxID=9258 RepID=A0A6I8N9T8_ORNAN